MSGQEEFGSLVLVVGDLHVSSRVPQLSAKLKEMLPSNKFSMVISTGNLGSQDTVQWVKSLASNSILVKGDCEVENSTLPQQKVVEIKGRRVGIIHGHQIIPWGDQQALLVKAKQMNVTILLSGHTHEMKVSELQGVSFLNPGSLTGSYSPIKSEAVNSFLILQFKANDVVVYGYEMIEGELRTGRYMLGGEPD